MPIAKVEPLTTARALRGPFDYLLPERARRGRGRLASCASRSAAGGCSASWSSSPRAATLPAERLAEPIEALEAGVPPELVELGLWVGARVLLDPGARPRAGAAARGPAAPAVRPSRARETVARAVAGGARGGRAHRARRAPAEALELLAGEPGEVARSSLAERRDRPRRAPPARGARPGRARRARASAAGARQATIGGARRRRSSSRRPSAARPPRIVAALDGASASCCCTASPARARPRSTSRGRRGGARARPRGDRPGPRDRR